MDYAALRKEGIEYLQKYSGALWTDYNHHDPGVTIFEYLCFAITDLAYRCNFNISDLLYSSENNRQEQPSNAFFPPHEILTCAPVTITDIKSLMLDHFKDVLDDIWITPVSDRNSIRGLYDFKLRLKDYLSRDEADLVIDRVQRVYLQNRALGEDIHSISVLDKRVLSVKAIIEISPEVSPTQVLSTILRNLEKCLTPSLQIKSYGEMVASGTPQDELFDGPPPVNGFIVRTDFSSPYEIVHLSVLRDAVSETNGVTGIRDMTFMIDDITVFSEEVILDDNTCLVLSPLNALPGSHQITFIRNDQEVAAELNVANQMWQAAVARDDQQLQSKKYHPEDQPVSRKRLEDIAAYHSIQQLFPVVYGITSFGTSGASVPRVQAQARQLKGYLAIFEILLASSLKQVSRLRHLFRVQHPYQELSEAETDVAYTTQFPFDIPDIDPLLRAGTEETRRTETEEALKKIAAISDSPLERKIQFLSHLLSRFGETIEPDFLKKVAEWGSENSHQLAVRMYSRMISEYVPSGGRRGTGYNYLEIPADQHPGVRSFPGMSSLKSRLCILLDIPQKGDLSCTDFFPFDQFQTPSRENSGTGIPIKSLLRSGSGSEGYEIVHDGEAWTLFFIDGPGKRRFRLGAAENRDVLISQRDEFISLVRQFDESSTNFYILEHVLLRPLSPPVAKMTFRAPLSNGFVQMKSPKFTAPGLIDQWTNSLLVIGSNTNNFLLKQDDEAPDQFFVAIHAGEDEILVSEESYPEEITRILIATISENMSRIMQQDPSEIENLIGVKDWKSDGIDGDADAFYSMRMSMIAPNWPSRFSAADRRQLFERLVIQFAPAHLKIDFLWLNWTQMERFEDAYFSWRLAKATPGTAESVIDVFSDILADFLQEAGDNKLR